MAAHKVLTIVTIITFALTLIEARPPRQGQGSPQQAATNDSSDWNLGLEYNRYKPPILSTYF